LAKHFFQKEEALSRLRNKNFQRSR